MHRGDKYLVDYVNQLSPGMDYASIIKIFPNKYESKEDICKHDEYWMDKRYSNNKPYKDLTYFESESPRYSFVNIYFDSNNIIVGYDYNCSN